MLAQVVALVEEERTQPDGWRQRCTVVDFVSKRSRIPRPSFTWSSNMSKDRSKSGAVKWSTNFYIEKSPRGHVIAGIRVRPKSRRQRRKLRRSPMSDAQEVLAGLHYLHRRLRSESERLANIADALYLAGNTALCDRLNETASRLSKLSTEADALAGLYVGDAMRSAAESQKSVDKFVLALLESEIKGGSSQ